MKWYDIYNWNGSQSSIVKFQIKVYVSAFIVGLIAAVTVGIISLIYIETLINIFI